ncbi:MAG: glycolate oxidase subunit GlcF [Alphaproteobacteria bacterium]
MQTNFSLAQLADADIAEANSILRACVHCGFCTATCPTYVELGDELDSPRGRIYLIKNMLEADAPASAEVTLHVDRCLSCLSCMTTCPSGVHYMHLVDHARRHIEETYERPVADRWLRRLLAWLLPRPNLFRLALIGAIVGRPFKGLMPGRMRAMLEFAPASLPSPSPSDRPRVYPAEGEKLRRVALLIGCAQKVLAPQINEATIRLLTRHGCEVVVSAGAGCCGSLTHHMGHEDDALAAARANIAAWTDARVDTVVINASGCGTTVKDYGFMLREDAAWADRAAAIADKTRDISELIADLGLKPVSQAIGQRVAYHAACSLQHGQRVRDAPKQLLTVAGFTVVEPGESHLCCGSAGTYNLLQPELAGRLRTRKLANLKATEPDLIATGNIGCQMQIGTGAGVPVVHTVELLDWATGGPAPAALHGIV